MEEKINQLIASLKQNGSTFKADTLKELKKEVLQEIKKDQSIEDCLQDLTKELETYSSEFIHDTNEVISGLSSCIYLPNPDGTYSITVYGGNTAYDRNTPVDERTIFDLASITKLYTFILTILLIKQGYFKKEDEIRKLDLRFEALGDYKVEDILKMSGTLSTPARVADAKTKEEAFQILKRTYVSDHDFSYNQYTDFGFIILSKVIEKIVSEKIGKSMTFEEIMNTYLLIPWKLEETMFHPTGFEISGNGNKQGLVHDPKSRLLGGAVGSAGLFATSKGIKALARNLFKVENVNYSALAGTIIYPNSKQNNKGYAGIYQKHPGGLNKTFVPNEYATGSFAHQGFTGSVAVFDSKNRIHNHVLVNAIKDGEPRKPEHYIDIFTIYQTLLTQITLKAFLLNRYYAMLECSKDVEIKGRAK